MPPSAIACFPNHQSPNKVISELAMAVAGGTSTTQAQTDFTALFSGSNVSASVINKTFTDLVKAIGDSHVTTADLSTVASDEAAIQSDLKSLYPPRPVTAGTGQPGPGSTGKTGNGSTGGTRHTGHHHRGHALAHVVRHPHSHELGRRKWL